MTRHWKPARLAGEQLEKFEPTKKREGEYILTSDGLVPVRGEPETPKLRLVRAA